MRHVLRPPRRPTPRRQSAATQIRGRTNPPPPPARDRECGLPPTPAPSASVPLVNGPFLTLLAAIIAALMALGVLGAVWPRRTREAIGFSATGLAGLAAILALISLLLDEAPAMLALPLGLPGAAFRLTLDPLAAFFALLVFGTGAATCAFVAADDSATTYDPASAPGRVPDAGGVHAAGRPTDAGGVHGAVRPTGAGLVPVCLAGLGLALLAADGFARGAGLAVAGGAIWALGPGRPAGAAQLGVALLAAAAVIVAAAAPPPVPLLAALVGPGALAGLVPLHAWLTRTHRAPAPAAACCPAPWCRPRSTPSLRMLFDPAGAAPPAWWGLPLMLLGAASVAAGGLDATRREELDTALAAGTVRQTGLTAIGLGIALTARAADLPGVTAMALGAVLLLAALQAICGTLLPLVAGAIRQGAGTRRLDRLGGLVHRMPITTACLLAGLFGVCRAAARRRVRRDLAAVPGAAGPAPRRRPAIPAPALRLGRGAGPGGGARRGQPAAPGRRGLPRPAADASRRRGRRTGTPCAPAPAGARRNRHVAGGASSDRCCGCWPMHPIRALDRRRPRAARVLARPCARAPRPPAMPPCRSPACCCWPPALCSGCAAVRGVQSQHGRAARRGTTGSRRRRPGCHSATR